MQRSVDRTLDRTVDRLHKVAGGLRWWGRALVRHVPEKPYPSDHPSSLRRR